MALDTISFLRELRGEVAFYPPCPSCRRHAAKRARKSWHAGTLGFSGAKTRFSPCVPTSGIWHAFGTFRDTAEHDAFCMAAVPDLFVAKRLWTAKLLPVRD